MKRKIILKSVFIMAMIVFLNFCQINIANAADEKNNDPMLKEIKINGVDIDPAFEMFTTEYVVNVDSNVTTAKIEAIPDDSNAKVKISGDENLKEGRNVFEINVTAENGKDKQNYYVYITRGDKEKSNANLKSLKIGEYELAPNFSPDTINYAFEYPQNLESLDIEAIPENQNAKVEIIGNENLKEVTQNIQIKVTAEDGQTVKTYYLTAKKAEGQVENPEAVGEETNVEPRTTQNEENSKNRNEIIIYGIGIISLGLIIIFIIFIIKKKGEKNENK